MTRLVECAFPDNFKSDVTAALDRFDEIEWTLSQCDKNVSEVRLIAPADKIQEILDTLQSLLAHSAGWRIVVLPVEATILPSTIGKEAVPVRRAALMTPREEIYHDVSAGAALDGNFIVLTVLSAIVATLGLNNDNVAVVIGAMVIAPLLGPLVAFSFASALGDRDLMVQSARTALAGLSVGFATAYAISLMIGVNIESRELMDRSTVGLDSIALALASGAAAALSIVSGLSSTLVGVMVAVALLPPSVAVAMFLGAGELSLAARAALLLAINIVSVNLASQIVYLVKGVRPRTWVEQRAAKQSRRLNLFVWGGLLSALLVFVLVT